MRSAVDLPQPDGPSSTRNSRSAIVEREVAHGDDVAEPLRHVLEARLRPFGPSLPCRPIRRRGPVRIRPVPWSAGLRVRVRPTDGPPQECRAPGPGRVRGRARRGRRWRATPTGCGGRSGRSGRQPSRSTPSGLVWDGGPAGDDPRLFVQRLPVVVAGPHAPPRRRPRSVARRRVRFRSYTPVSTPIPVSPAPASCGPSRSRCSRPVPDRVGASGSSAASSHAGTIRVTLAGGRLEVCAEAWLGGAEVTADAARVLHPIAIEAGDDASALLGDVGRARGRGRGRAPRRAVRRRLVLLVPVLRRCDRARVARQPRAGRRVAVRRVPARRRLPARDRRLAVDQRPVPVGRGRRRRRDRRVGTNARHLDRAVPRRARERPRRVRTPTGSPARPPATASRSACTTTSGAA